MVYITIRFVNIPPYPNNEIAIRPSFREKTALASLLTTVAVYGPYFVYVFGQFARGTPAVIAMSGAFIVAVALQTILMVVAHVIFALHGRPEGKDERDLAIEARSFRYAYIAFAGGAWTAAGLALAWAGAQSAPPGSHHVPLLMLQAFLLAFVLAETTKFLVQVVGYRREH